MLAACLRAQAETNPGAVMVAPAVTTVVVITVTIDVPGL